MGMAGRDWRITARALFCAGLFVVSAVLPARAQKSDKPPPEDPEVKLGRENAKANDEQPDIKFITDAKLLDKVNKIGQDIAAIANTEKVPATWGNAEVKKFKYTFKIVDDKDVNAYSLPGGFIYINKGLLDYVHSDDELAGVLAHEIAHASHHHMMKLLKEQSKMQPFLSLAFLAMIFLGGNKTADLGTLAIAGQLYMVAKLNSYGVEAEKDADQTGMRYLTHTKYNPVGLLTFMERLARDETRKPDVEMGIYRTHPPSPDRARALLAQLQFMEIAVNRHVTDPYLSAKVGTVTVNGVSLAEVTFAQKPIVRLASAGGLKAGERAERFSDALNDLMDKNLKIYEVKLNTDKSGILARNELLLAITSADSEPQGMSVQKLAQNAFEAIRNLIWQTQFDRIPATSSR